MRRRSTRTRRDDAGLSRATEALVILMITAAAALATVTGPLADNASCFAQRTIALMESSGGDACGEPVRETYLPVPQPSGPYTPTPVPPD